MQDTDSSVDTINRFIEVYMDPRGIKGSWEALVLREPGKTGRIKTLGANAQWFEDHMPWPAKYRKPDVQGIVANAIDVVIETGDSGPVTPIGINLPNDQAIREKLGSKSVALSNVIEAYDQSSPGSMRSEFSWTPEEADRASKFGEFSSALTTDMHEVIGHASGRQSESLSAPPQASSRVSSRRSKKAGRTGRPLLHRRPEARGARHHPSRRPGRHRPGRVRRNAQRAGAAAARPRGSQIEEDHMRNRQMIVRWLMANTKAIEERTRDSKTYTVMVDPAAFREGVGQLLAAVRASSRRATSRARRRCSRTTASTSIEAPRRDRRARGHAEPAVLHRFRDAEADGRDRRRRDDHGRDDLLPDGPHRPDARCSGVRK
ncbi:MAG: hypothetical protein R2712_25645 [Vicinamibacterales bacterium]